VKRESAGSKESRAIGTPRWNPLSARRARRLEHSPEIRQFDGDVARLQGDVKGLPAEIDCLVRIGERVTA
jgi:hypothetical protein